MATRELKLVTNHMSCPICYRLYKDPKVLPCQHSYCLECLSKLERNRQVTCPECRKVADVPDGGIQEFKTNFFINRLVDDYILKRKVEGEEEVHCEARIENDPVTTFCSECVLFMCQACDNHHKRNRNTHQHHVISLTDLRTKQDIKDKVKPKKQVLLCKKHDIELKFYCETCKELVCLYCTTKAHSTHSHDAIKEVAAKHREQLKKTTAPLKDMITKLSQVHSNISDTKEEMLKQHKSVDKQIDEYYSKILQRVTNNINKQCQQLKQDLQNMVMTEVEVLSSQLKKVKSVWMNMTSVDQLAGEIEGSSNDEILSGEQQIVCCVKEVTDAFNEFKTNPMESQSPYFIPSYPDIFPQFGCISKAHELQCEIAGFPTKVMQNCPVEFAVITKEATINNEGSNFTVQLIDGWGKKILVTLNKKENNNYTGSFKVELVGHYQLLVSIKGQQIKGSPLSFYVSKDYSKIKEPVKVINNNGKMSNPSGVGVSNNQHWAMADNTKHCVYIFDQDDQLVKEFGCNGHENGQFCSPRGVAFDDDNCLYVVDGNNHRVQKFNLNGDYLLQFGKQGTMEGQLCSPVGITVHFDKVFIADRSNHRISVYWTDGTYQFSFGSRGYDAGQLINPWDVVVTPDNTVCVVDVGNARIQVFKLDGTFINSFGSPGTGKGQLDGPSSIAVDPNGFVFVTEKQNKRVSIFDNEQYFFHSFYSQYPHGIAISHTGTIYVTNYEYGNSRVTAYV